jgi:hypothetical protein
VTPVCSANEDAVPSYRDQQDENAHNCDSYQSDHQAVREQSDQQGCSAFDGKTEGPQPRGLAVELRRVPHATRITPTQATSTLNRMTDVALGSVQ